MPAITRRGPQDVGVSPLATIAAMGGYRPQPSVALAPRPQVSAVQPIPTSLPTIAPSAGGNILQEGARESTSGVRHGLLPWVGSIFGGTPGVVHGHRDPATGEWIPGRVANPYYDRVMNAGAGAEAVDRENRAMNYSDQANRLAMNQTAQQAEEQRKSAAQAQKNAMESQTAAVKQTQELSDSDAERLMAAARGMTVEQFRQLDPEIQQQLKSDIQNQQRFNEAATQSAVDIFGGTKEALQDELQQGRLIHLPSGDIVIDPRLGKQYAGMSDLTKSIAEQWDPYSGAKTGQTTTTQGQTIPVNPDISKPILQGAGIPGVDLFNPQAAPAAAPIPFANPNDAAAAAAVAPPSAVSVAPGAAAAVPAGYIKRPASAGGLFNALIGADIPLSPEEQEKQRIRNQRRLEEMQ